MSATYSERTRKERAQDPQGKDVKEVGVVLEQQYAQAGALRVDKTAWDLGRLEEIARRGAAFGQDASVKSQPPHWDKPDKVEQIGRNLTVSLFKTSSPDGTDRVSVRLDQIIEKGIHRFSQTALLSQERLEEVVKSGKDFERELGHARQYFVALTPNRLSDPSVIEGKVKAAFTDRQTAEEYAHINSKPGTQPPEIVVATQPYGWRPQVGETISVSVDETRDEGKPIAKHVECFKFDAERLGPTHVLAQWNDRSRTPTTGQVVEWDQSSGVDYTGKPRDFKVGPAEGKKTPGDPSKPQWVVFDREDRKIVDGFASRPQAQECLRTLEAVELARSQQREAMMERARIQQQQTDPIDLSKESFRPRQ